ncbi:hypothetical protein GGR21_003773 [Dysgonomonas hofstadii]|uniref:Homeodomain phBC6A51-type domain-containing protein n=1 Tax=Dysgonomonas hofstadii TaxID=637886 RepID=A0A840CZM7_9BACT|nr:phBC6A51 family helix-turn-helix protein [Dysgonomonas hofstadii]MBB4037852.1 hypothetical protein [Dysgonomonas hofstadii]
MAKFNEELQTKIIELLGTEFFSISQTCKILGISRQIFYTWMNEKPEFKTEVEEAIKYRNEELMSLAYMSIKKRLKEGTTVVEKDTYIPDETDDSRLKFKSRTITTKDYMPDLRTVRMILDRNDKQSHTSSETRKTGK